MYILGIQIKFWVIYVLAPIIVLLLFQYLAPRWAPLALLICPVLDFLFFMDEFFYARWFALLFTGIQMLLTAVPALLIWARARR